MSTKTKMKFIMTKNIVSVGDGVQFFFVFVFVWMNEKAYLIVTHAV